MRTVLILGANGQLGTELQRALRGSRVVPWTRAELDVCDHEKAGRLLSELRPDVVVNTTAFHRVDLCESQPEATFLVNAVAPYRLARLAAELGFTLLHFSTDYVFDGSSRVPYTEEDPPNPLSVYGLSKLTGERLVQRYAPRHFVLRTTGLYGAVGSTGKGGNFVETMIRLGKTGNPVRVVGDQVCTPTWTGDLARAVTALLAREGEASVPYGLYHLTSAGACSWFEFAAAIFELCGMTVDLRPITSDEYAAPASRPAYSVLAHRRWLAAGFQDLRPWRDGLRDYLEQKGHREPAATL